MFNSSGRRLCSTGAANSQGNLQQKDLPDGNTNQAPDWLQQRGIRLGAGESAVSLPALSTFPCPKAPF